MRAGQGRHRKKAATEKWPTQNKGRTRRRRTGQGRRRKEASSEQRAHRATASPPKPPQTRGHTRRKRAGQGCHRKEGFTEVRANTATASRARPPQRVGYTRRQCAGRGHHGREGTDDDGAPLTPPRQRGHCERRHARRRRTAERTLRATACERSPGTHCTSVAMKIIIVCLSQLMPLCSVCPKESGFSG